MGLGLHGENGLDSEISIHLCSASFVLWIRGSTPKSSCGGEDGEDLQVAH